MIGPSRFLVFGQVCSRFVCQATSFFLRSAMELPGTGRLSYTKVTRLDQLVDGRKRGNRQKFAQGFPVDSMISDILDVLGCSKPAYLSRLSQQSWAGVRAPQYACPGATATSVK